MRKKEFTIFCLWTIIVNYPCKTAVALASHNRHLAFCSLQYNDAIYFKPAQTTRLLSNIGRISDSFWTSISDCFCYFREFLPQFKIRRVFSATEPSKSTTDTCTVIFPSCAGKSRDNDDAFYWLFVFSLTD